jgi:23S rRNA pseudouridine1911/1915/1917 synthase
MGERLTVDRPEPLFDLLTRRLAGWNRNTLRERLRAGCVRVNGETVTRRDQTLQPGDEVEVVALDEGQAPPRGARGLPTLHADEDLIAIDKPAGLLSVSSERQRERTALALVRASLSRPGRPARLWPVHRLDRETSGVLLLARSREACDQLRGRWHEASKTYLAVVEGLPRPEQGLIDEPLWEDRALNVRVGSTPDAKEARTGYSTLKSAHGRALLEVELVTGRRHQIRAHLAWLGHPVVGDARYGTRGPRMGLHAWRLQVPHPRDGRRLELEAPVPRELTALLDRAGR